MSALATRQVTQAGSLQAPVAAAAGGDSMETGPYNYLRVTCGATGCTVTIDSVVPCNQGVDHDLVVVVASNTTRDIGPINDRFTQPSTGRANITYTQVSTVTVEAVRV